MPSRTEKHIEELIHDTVHRHMQDAGEPRPEIMWTGIRKQIAAGGETTFRRTILTRIAFFKWPLAGIAVAACLLAVMVFLPVFPTARVVQEPADGRAVVAGGGPACPGEGMPATRHAPVVSPTPDAKEMSSALETLPAETPVEADQVMQSAETEPMPASQNNAAARVRAGDPTTAADADPAEEAAPAGGSARLFAASTPGPQEGLSLSLSLPEARATAPFPVRYPAYIPPHFTEDSICYQALSDRSGEVLITFTRRGDASAVIHFTQQNLGNGYGAGRGYDLQPGERRTVCIRGNEATLSEVKGERGVWNDLTWQKDSISYRVQGEADRNDIIKMAESLQP